MDITNCGSTFIVMKKVSSQYRPPSNNDFLQSGEKIDAAGYCCFGPQVQLVYHAGFRVNIYTYSEVQDRFILTHSKVKASDKKGIIRANLAFLDEFSKNV